ncbi:NMD5 [Candida oxycetoniae]|uniref:NMD5 n=1 Tax=Candida oxycetoniae TaxID=497107 RepID=A0AAI9WWV1_9ASCO|nr:NMD5 [Candida oxycetoniae]KAI3403398.2 NMD5 [Candida oxycetoniae]
MRHTTLALALALAMAFYDMKRTPPSDIQHRHKDKHDMKHTRLTVSVCLDILESSKYPSHIKKAAAVYFKNRVVKFWNIKDVQNPLRVDADEKPIVKERIVPVIFVCDHNIKQQLLPALRLLINVEFDSWSQLLEQTGQLLHKSKESHEYLYTAILCLEEITRKFKWSDNKSRQDKLDPIITQAFPYLLQLGQSIVASHQQGGEEITEINAEILKLILKCYKFVTYYEIPNLLREKDQILQWGEFHASVIEMRPPSYVVNSKASEQEKSLLQISKCYKWAVANILRLFIRYASTNSLSKKIIYPEFHALFLNEFIPHFLTHFLKVIKEYCSGERWIGSSELYQLLEFLSHCVSEASVWSLVQPHFETLVAHLIYPIVVPSDLLLEVYEEDPQEYISLCFDSCGDYDNAEYAALGFIATALYKHPNLCLPPISNLIQNELTQLQQQNETLEVAKRKDGIMRILGSISGYLPKDSTMEPLMTSLIIPNLDSKHEFLKARAIEVCSQFAEVTFSNRETLFNMINSILKNFDDEDASLPVQFNTALSIQAFIVNDEFKQALSNIILNTMSKLLELSNEIDNDAISVIMQECVENFSEQLQPFGVDLMTRLVQQFLKLASEINEASKLDIDDFDANYDDQGDKAMAALGFLNTMITVLLSFENSQELCIRLEEICSPAIEFVLVNQIDDFFAEIGELIENATFLLRAITPVMWNNFKLLLKQFEEGGALMYFEELLPCLTNYLVYGKKTVQENAGLQNDMLSILQMAFAQDGDVVDLELVFQLAQTFILCLEAKAEPYIPEILNVVLNNLKADDAINVIVASLVYGSATASILGDRLPEFLTTFMERSPKTVYSLKLSLLGLVRIMDLGLLDHEHAKAKYDSWLQQLVISLQKKEQKIDSITNSKFGDVVDGNGHVDGDGDEEDEFEDEEYEDPLSATALDDFGLDFFSALVNRS